MVKTDFSYSERRWYVPRMLLLFVLGFLSISETSAQALACNDNVQVSLNLDCEADITPGMILEGEDEDLLPNYVVTIEGISGTIVSTPGIYSVTVTDITNDNSCWGNITVEDKLAPIIEDCNCPEGNTDPDCEFLCTDLEGILDGSFSVPTPVVYENCGSFTSEYADQVSDGGCGEKIIIRSWLFTDDAGNVTSGCTQEFRTLAVSTTDIVAPVSPVILPCGSDVSMPAIVDYFIPIVGEAAAVGYGYPTVNGVAINGAICNLAATKTDVIIPICNEECSNSFKVLRNWVILDWCTAESIEFNQIIKSVDEEDPTIDAKDITVSTDPWVCEGNFFLPAPEILHDNCTDYVTYEVTGPAGVIIVWDPDFNLYFATGAPKGVHTFNYIASDCCNNTAVDPITVTVADMTAPVAVAKQNIVVSLTQAVNGVGQAKIFANSVDNGSHDGCTGVKLEIRRDNDECGVVGNATYNNDGHSFDASNDPDQGQFVKFCCEDLTNAEVDVDGDGELDPGYVKVWLRVWDDGDMNGTYGSSGDNFNETWAFVKVEDKLDPIIVCPADITVNCDVDCEDLNMVGEATATASCGDVEVEYTDIVNTLNSCNVGFITRRWSVVGNSSVFCDQRITKSADDYFDGAINWPGDFNTDCTDIDDENIPTWGDTGCSLVGYSVESDTFQFEDGACFKIINYWTVIDWCQYDPNGTSNNGMWNHVQIIKVLDDEAPVMSCTDQMYAVDDNNDADNDGNQCEILNLMLTNTADDNGDCASDWLKWTVLVDLWGDGEYDYEFSSYLPQFDGNINNDTNGNGIPDRYLAPTASGEEVKVTLPENIEGSMANHKVLWKVSDGCQNITSCENTFMVVDKKAPTPYCIDISTALMESGMVELWACDFDLGSFDNCTMEGDLRFTFTDTKPQSDPNYNSDSKCSSRIFDCDDLENSPIAVTMYVWDEKDNYDFCEVMLTLVDNQGGCDNGGGMKISGAISTFENTMVEDAMVNLVAPSIELDKMDMTNESGIFNFVNNPDNFAYQLQASKEGNYLDGVSTLDLVMIQRHILGLQSFENAYNVVASDINNDEKITASDLVQLRKLILGIVDEYPDNESYRFIASTQTFDDISHPWPLQEDIIIDPLHHDMADQNFKAVKIGDVSGNATYGLSSKVESQNRNAKTSTLIIDNQTLVTGGQYKIPVLAGDENLVSGLQASILLNGMTDIKIQGGALNIEQSNVALTDGQLNISWAAISNENVEKGDVLFTITGKATAIGELSKLMKLNLETQLASEIYNEKLEVFGLELKTRTIESEYALELSQNEPNPFDVQTQIAYTVPKEGRVQLNVVDIAGKMVYTATQNAMKGSNVFVLGAEDLGQSGIYYYSIITATDTKTKKLIFVK